MTNMTAKLSEINPFGLSPDPEYMYLTQSLAETIDKVRFCLDRRQGLTVVYGEVGHGKSTLVRYLFDDYRDRSDVVTAKLTSPDYRSDLQFLKAICDEFGLKRKQSKIDQEQELKRFLHAQYVDDKNVVVFVDEAQRLKGHVLELVRGLLNFETNSAKLINVVLCGQLELRDTLRDKSKKSLRSRIFLVSTLNALSLAETTAVIDHRCQIGEAPNPFTSEGVEAVFTLSRGVPRDVIKLCEIAWLFSLRNGLKEIGPELVTASAAHLELEGHA